MCFCLRRKRTRVTVSAASALLPQVPIIVVGCKLDRQVCSEGKNALPEEHLEALLEYRHGLQWRW